MRRQYRHFLREGLTRFRPGWLMRGAMRFLTTPAATRRGRPITGPVFASFVVNYHCNLRCVFCDAWRSAQGGREGRPLTFEQVVEAFRDLRALGTMGVGFTGGEPLLDKKIYDYLGAAKSAGLVVHLNTNATKLDDAAAEALIGLGVDSINVSIDATTAEDHDAIRGKAGAFEAARAGIARVLERRQGRQPRVTMVSVVDSDTDVAGLHSLAESLGVDGLGLMPRHDLGGRPRRGLDDAAAAAETELRESLAALSASSTLLDNSKAYLDLFPRALRGDPNDVTCHTGVNHLVFDVLGKVYACMPFNEADRSWGDMHDRPIRDLWGSEAHQAVIGETRACRDCYWNCHTEMNLLFRNRGRL